MVLPALRLLLLLLHQLLNLVPPLLGLVLLRLGLHLESNLQGAYQIRIGLVLLPDAVLEESRHGCLHSSDIHHDVRNNKELR